LAIVPNVQEPAVRILVVEDDPQVRRMLHLLLGLRWSVRLADGGATALDEARAQPPDLIISDVRMPGMDGIELLRRLREDPVTQDVPVILVSARAGERETIAGLEAGADDFLVKPFSARELIVRVQTRLEVTSMRRRSAQQQEALASLERHTAWTERLLDSLPVPLLFLEPGSARILFANGVAKRLLSSVVVNEEALGDFLALRCPDEEGGATIEAAVIAPQRPEGRVLGRRVAWDTPDGRRWLLADCELLAGTVERPAMVVLTLRDVTDLVEKERDLRRALRIRDEFLSVASHELRTPLTTLGLRTESLLKGLGYATEEDERLRRRLASIRSQVSRLGQLVDALLDVTRLIEGRMQLHPEEVDLAALAAEVVEQLRESAARVGSPIRLRAPEGIVGSWDRLRIGQVLTNLVSNAIKFGAGRPIDVEVEDLGERACMRVRDAGIGIDPAARTRIFDRFERSNSEGHYPGLGLGLWIAKEIVEASRGSISVESREGAGSTFTVELPFRA
jgi:signal transduction histidine kinase/CheY-like chemotaxis protein